MCSAGWAIFLGVVKKASFKRTNFGTLLKPISNVKVQLMMMLLRQMEGAVDLS